LKRKVFVFPKETILMQALCACQLLEGLVIPPGSPKIPFRKEGFLNSQRKQFYNENLKDFYVLP